MKGIVQYLRAKDEFVAFIQKVKTLNPVGGSLLYFDDGEGMLVEPDLTEGIKVNLKTRELEYKIVGE